jgi:phosphoglycolate phosphatase
MDFKHFNTIIWDWNGTLLNDVGICIEAMNELLTAGNLPILTIDKYREVFTFPVQDYYSEIGIDFSRESFEIIGHDFMDLYFEKLPGCKLHSGVKEVLKVFRSAGIHQFILSAMEQNALEKSLFDFGIRDYFLGVYGIDNHLAAGKTDRAHQLIAHHKLNPTTTLMIGDTLHDLEVAKELNFDVLLIASGHQSTQRLTEKTPNVKNQLLDLIK